jgi:hypothetical protein
MLKELLNDEQEEETIKTPKLTSPPTEKEGSPVTKRKSQAVLKRKAEEQCEEDTSSKRKTTASSTSKHITIAIPHEISEESNIQVSSQKIRGFQVSQLPDKTTYSSLSLVWRWSAQYPKRFNAFQSTNSRAPIPRDFRPVSARLFFI